MAPPQTAWSWGLADLPGPVDVRRMVINSGLILVFPRPSSPFCSPVWSLLVSLIAPYIFLGLENTL